jgi:hypothetical protein
MTIRDAAGNAKTIIKAGAFDVITSATINTPSATITFPLTRTDTSGGPILNAKVVGATTSLGTVDSGVYEGAYSYNFISTPGDIVRVDATVGGYAVAQIGIELIASDGTTVVDTIVGATANVSNYQGNTSANSNDYGSSAGLASIYVPTTGTYFSRPYYLYTLVKTSGTGYVGVFDHNVTLPAITFTKANQRTEVTEEGVQIVSSTSRYVKFKTSGAYDIESLGSWFHSGGDVDLCKTTGQAYVKSSLITTVAGNYSDIRLKQDISDYNLGLSHIKLFNPKWFRFKKRPTNQLLAGLIAQDVEKVSKEYVNEDSEGNKELNYPAVYMTMLNAIKELSNKVESMEAYISSSKI